MKNREIIVIITIIGLVSILKVYFFGGSICLIYNTIGIPCLTCGMTRAYISILKLNFKEAFYYHPLFFMVPLIFIEKIRKKYMFLIFIVFLIVWIIRMYLYFPNTEPMKYNKFIFNEIIYNKIRRS